jgi:DUF1365 family protein
VPCKASAGPGSAAPGGYGFHEDGLRSGLDAADSLLHALQTAVQPAIEGRMNALPLIGFGHVWHRRLRPVEHAFRYPATSCCCRCAACARSRTVLRRNRLGWLSFHDSDHGEGGPDALAWFEQLLHSEGIDDADGDLAAHPARAGLCVQARELLVCPPRRWLAGRRAGRGQQHLGERHAYLLAGPDLAWGREQVAQGNSMSRRSARSGEYRFRFERSGNAPWRVDLHDETARCCRPAWAAAASAGCATVRRAFFGTPLMTLGVIARIHWQALRLWAKRVPFHGKPAARALRHDEHHRRPLLSPTAAAPRRTPARARRVLNLLERLPHGQLDLEQPDGRLLHLPANPARPRRRALRAARLAGAGAHPEVGRYRPGRRLHRRRMGQPRPGSPAAPVHDQPRPCAA